MIINDLDDYYIVFDTKNRNTELDTLTNNYKSKAVWNTVPTKSISTLLIVKVVPSRQLLLFVSKSQRNIFWELLSSIFISYLPKLV